jgi:hypothetical protein
MFDFISWCIILIITSPIILLALLLSSAILDVLIDCIKGYNYRD